MADSTAFTFKTDSGEERSINPKDLVAVVPGPDDSLSTVIYVEHDPQDDTALPKAIITKGTAQPTIPLQDTSDEETHIIISTASGTTKAQLFHDQVLTPILESLFPKGHPNFLTHVTDSPSSIKNLTSDIFLPTAQAGIPLRILLLSGDGGIVDLINGLSSHPKSPSYLPPKLVLLPLGTANALYHSTTAGQDTTWGLRALASQVSKPLPTFTATFSPGARLLTHEGQIEEALPTNEAGDPVLHGAVVASWAMHASLVADSDTPAYRPHGISRFQMAAKEALFPAGGSLPHAYQGTISLLRNGEWSPIPETQHMYVLASLVSNLERKFCISPHTGVLDGRLAVVRFGPRSGGEAMRVMGLAYEGGRHVEEGDVLYEMLEGVRIEIREGEGRWRRVCVDGVIVRVEEGGWVEVRRGEGSGVEVVVG